MLIYAEEGVIVLLTENEWNAINNILLELYTIKKHIYKSER